MTYQPIKLLVAIRAMTDRQLADALRDTLSVGAWRDALVSETERREVQEAFLRHASYSDSYAGQLD